VDELLRSFWQNLTGRLAGPMKFRFILPPIMAAMFAVKIGLQDAREGLPAYFWEVVGNPSQHRELLHEGWGHVSKIFIVAVLIGLVYQNLAFRWFCPGEALLVAFVLAVIPYLLLRGPVNRIARRGKSDNLPCWSNVK